MATKLNHAHKLKRHTYKNGSQIYFCTLDCGFKVSCELSLGKTAVCWRCGEEFKLNSYSITLAKPHCEKCHVRKHEITQTNRRRKTDIKPIEHPVELVTAGVGVAVTNDLKERLEKISHGESVSKVIEYRPLKEEDEDLL